MNDSQWKKNISMVYYIILSICAINFDCIEKYSNITLAIKLKWSSMKICHALHDLVPFVQFKKRENHPWRSFTLSKVAGWSACSFTKSKTPPWVFFTFLKLYKWYQIAQRTTYAIGRRNILSEIKLTHSKHKTANFS